MQSEEEFTRLREPMTRWRHHLHAHPELGYEEHGTSAFVADRLEEFGLEVTRGLAGTGVVGTLRCGETSNAIGLRADMDALPIEEKNQFGHRSQNSGRMHACGHDGHTTMLLGAAAWLAETRSFDGIAHFIFQPAEENAGGGDQMVKDGLFERFPVAGVYGLHNWPGLEASHFAAHAGAVMGSVDEFEITITGQGCHAAMPELGRDPFTAISHILSALQSLPGRRFAATDALVVSVTQIHGGTANNVIPDRVAISGTVRTLDNAIRDSIESSIHDIATGTGRTTGTSIEVKYNYGYPATLNHASEAGRAAAAASCLVGRDHVHRNLKPSLAAEDFAYMLQARPGAYVWLGNGRDSAPLHSNVYDFNDNILTTGAAYWAGLVRQELAPSRPRY